MADDIGDPVPTKHDSQTGTSSQPVPRGRPTMLSGGALIIALVALGLAVIPMLAYDRPLSNPFAVDKAPEPRVEPPPEREGGVNLRFKGLSVNIGGKVPEQKPPRPDPPPQLTRDPVRWFTIAAAACAVIGLGIASYGHYRERHWALTVCTMGLCVAALSWQYFAVGIIAGAAVAAFLIVLAIFAPALG